MNNFSQRLKVFALLLGLLLTGCASPYICPLKDQPGACSSQSKTYQAALHPSINSEKDSIFDTTT